jgi:hypothetical protein
MVLEELPGPPKDLGLCFRRQLLQRTLCRLHIFIPREAEPVAQVDRSSGTDPEPGRFKLLMLFFNRLMAGKRHVSNSQPQVLGMPGT